MFDICRPIASADGMRLKRENIDFRVAKLKCPCVLNDQNTIEDNRKLRGSCPPDNQIICERNDPRIFILTNLLSYLSLTNKINSMRTNTTYIYDKVPEWGRPK